MSKVTIQAPANIAFIKYWGRSDHKLFLPLNDNISMTLSGCTTTTTAELINGPSNMVEVKFLGKEYTQLTSDSIKARNIFDQITRIKKLAKSSQSVHIKSKNNFPADAGIASSASGFAALTGALLLAYGLNELYEDKKEFSRQVRLCGSGSAVRSVYGGFVEMFAGMDHKSSFAQQIADEHYWELVDIVAIVDADKKKISSSEGHETAETSPFLKTRIEHTKKQFLVVRKAILEKDFQTLGEALELESTSMHAVMMTQSPPAFYWNPGSISIIKQIRELREQEHMLAYTTFDAGANAHIICQKEDASPIEAFILKNPFVKSTIYNEPAPGAHEVSNHLF
ncbi:MAG: diphosphomevalonate decarboxylase [Candidatus Roizmanbacteria bacterium]|nr:diphosphomevalonate decarboxylase [Candidatus Roizmanbacteria bacterium]